jgi:hypothetical protein
VSIRYSGTVNRVTSSLRDIFKASNIQAEPIADGVVEIGGFQGDIDNGGVHGNRHGQAGCNAPIPPEDYGTEGRPLRQRSKLVAIDAIGT